MPYTPGVGDILRLRIVTYTSSQIGVNTAHFKVTAVAGAAQTDAAIAAAFDTALAPRYTAVLSVGARYRGVSIQKIFPLPPKVPQAVVTNDGPGLVAGDMMAGQIAGLIWAKTANAGPTEKGRMYLPFVGEASNAATGVPTAGYVTDITDIADEVYTPVTVGAGGDTITLDPVVWHRGTLTATGIDSYGARTIWGTQRRRGSYGQMNLPPF